MNLSNFIIEEYNYYLINDKIANFGADDAILRFQKPTFLLCQLCRFLTNYFNF